jgi:hypothetical protein
VEPKATGFVVGSPSEEDSMEDVVESELVNIRSLDVVTKVVVRKVIVVSTTVSVADVFAVSSVVVEDAAVVVV